MPIYHTAFEQRSAEWYRVRLGIPTASEFSRIVTPKQGKASEQASKYMNRLLAEWVLGEPIANEYESPWMELGRENEEYAARAFEFQTGLQTDAVGFVTDETGLIGASPDLVVLDGGSEGFDASRLIGTVEIKCASAPVHLSYLLRDDSIESYYRAQVQGQLWILELDKSWVVAYHPKLPPVITEIGRDEEMIGKLRSGVTAFVEVMLAKREDLERRFGPFARPEPVRTEPADKHLGNPVFGSGWGITDEDVEWATDPRRYAEEASRRAQR